MTDVYFTIKETAQGQVREKMSRFISFAIPVTSQQQAREVIASYTNRYHDARHVCWGMRLGHNPSVELSNDNGEPSGTAGRPILGQILSAGLTDTLIVVVRYFGGIKLGTSGLITAYKEAAKEAIDAAAIIQKRLMSSVSFTFPYLAMQHVMKLAKKDDIEVVAQQFDNTCSMTLAFPLDMEGFVKGVLASIDGVTLQGDCQ